MKGNPFTYEQVKERFKEYGYDLLDNTEPFGNQTKMTCADKEGYIYHTTMNNISNGCVPNKVHKTNKYSSNNVQLFLTKSGVRTKILTKGAFGSRDIIQLKCECGNIFSTYWTEILTRNRCKCSECRKKKQHLEHRLNKTEIRKFYKSKGFIFQKGEKYTTANKSIKCFDKEGYKVKVSYNNLSQKKNYTPFRFSRTFLSEEDFIYNVNNYFKINNIDCIALSTNISNGKTHCKINCKCSCGNLFITDMDSIRASQFRCRYCSKMMSRIEFKTEEFLIENLVEYEFQKRFEDCINPETGRILPFDFYLPKYNTIIECDGYQHFYPSTFYKSSKTEELRQLRKTKKYDKLKNKYCKDNNMNLVRIRFTAFNTEKYKEIILDIIH